MKRTTAAAISRPMLLMAWVLGSAALLIAGRTPEINQWVQPPLDKLAHFVAFGTLAALAMLATRCRAPLSVLWGGLLLAATDELGQRSVPGRSADVFDFMTDLAAIVVVVLAGLAISRWRGRAGAPTSRRRPNPAPSSPRPQAPAPASPVPKSSSRTR